MVRVSASGAFLESLISRFALRKPELNGLPEGRCRPRRILVMAQFYTLEEAARVLGISPDELKAQAQSRKVRAFMDSGSWRFRVADIDEHARRSGMGSDPDLSLSDLDMIAGSSDTGSQSGDDIDLSEFQLVVASPDMANQ